MLQEAGRPLSPLVLTKLFFLMRHEAEVSKKIAGFYDFVPYKFGPYSFALHNDLAGLKRNGYVENSDEDWRLGRLAGQARNWMDELDKTVSDAIRSVYLNRGRLKTDELLKHVYSTYPWFASRSELKHLVPSNVPGVKLAKPAVYTAGYQQKTVDGFLSGLLREGIRCIIDVRSNPVSRNYGFAARTLTTLAGRLGLQYKHFPQLGIPSADRKGLDSEEQFDLLFLSYRKNVLPREADSLSDVAALVQATPSALLCYEADPSSCHRSHLADAINKLSGLGVVHLR
jgi:uncharacterized protein (DUF488 family)